MSPLSFSVTLVLTLLAASCMAGVLYPVDFNPGKQKGDPTPIVGYLSFLNGLLTKNLQAINSEAQKQAPASYGNCGDNSPPQPCMDTGDNIYYVHVAWEYKAFARWITGLNSIQLTLLNLSSVPGNVMMRVQGLFAKLPLSLYIGECFTFDQCSILWDNTDGCCGSNKHFTVDLFFNCSATAPYFPSLGIKAIQLDDFEITEKIIGISINVEDITNTIKSTVSGLITEFLTKKALISYDGGMVTVLQFLNVFANDTFSGAPIQCP
eukprot:gnl/Hemi2/13026_TR4449_c0_g4_i1.p1 gnl/Hemi2/13026_TR4449_c0_g4~~gnl/Hemi2/13026_TR4449_c0_g4_i1.p1  ORF type:complete len:265 (-),score=121.44 gnl/Hemi2/13026_TR4449_c0_g4_i1:98-892(-)